MKKEILVGAIALLIGVGVMAQSTEPVQEQVKTKKQLRIDTRQQAKVQEQTRSGDPIMTQTQTQAQTRTRDQKKEQVQEQTQSGDPIMTQTRTQNHGAAVSETAKQAQTQTQGGVGEVVREQAKLQGETQKSMKQAKNSTKNKGAAKSVRTNRPATVKGTGAGRK